MSPGKIGPLMAAVTFASWLTGCSGGNNSNGTGTITTSTYTIGGSISGLTANGLVLADGSQTVSPASGASTFTFSTAVASGASYSVTVQGQPSHETCSVSSGSGTVGTSNVTTVAVSCVANGYTIGGTISGLTASGLVLAEGSQTVSPASGATSFTFPTAIATGSSYSVTVQTQPSGEACSVSNASGTIATSNITNVAVNCATSSEVVLYDFKGGTSDGGCYTTAGTLISHAGLVMDSAGNLYGTTQFGGTNNLGTVFMLTKGSSGSYTEGVLYSFRGGSSDGYWPAAGLILDSSGNLYGTTVLGGTGSCTYSQTVASCGTVFKLTKGSGGSYTESLLHSFDGGVSDGATPYSGLIMDSGGNLYGTTGYGGAGSCTDPAQPTGCGTVFKLAPESGGSYTESLLYSFEGGASDGNEPVAGLIADGGGNLYGTTAIGGSQGCNNFAGCGIVFQLAPDGNGTYTESLLYSFQGLPSDGAWPYGLIMDSAGNLYGTTGEGGTNSYGTGTVFRLAKSSGGGYTEKLLYSFQAGSPGGFAPEAGLIMDSSGNLYGTTQEGGVKGYGAVVELAPGSSGSYSESALYSFQSGTADGALPYAALIMDSGGNLYGTTVMGGANDQGTVFEIIR